MNDGNPLQFIDTNVLVYAHDRSAGQKHVRAKELLQELWDSQNGCLSIQALQEFYVTVTLKVANPLTRDAAAQIIIDLAQWKVHNPRVDDLLDAVRLQDRYNLSIWDAMILASALQLGCEVLWSEDFNSGQQYDQVTANNPFE